MRNKDFLEKIIIFFISITVAILFTYPLVKNIGTYGAGFDEDAPYQIWHNWWLYFSLFVLKISPLSTNYIFHPQNIPLIFDANSFVFGALTLPIQWLTGNVVLASNLVFLLFFGLSGISMFSLSKYLLINKLRTNLYFFPAFLASFIFAFSPYTIAQALNGHTNLTTTVFIPLFILFLIKTIDSKSLVNPIIAGVVASLQLYNDFTYTGFLILTSGIIIGIEFLFRLQKSNVLESSINASKELIIKLFPIGVVSVLLSFPILLGVFEISKTGFRAGSPLWVQDIWSADLVSFFLPSDTSRFLKSISYTSPRGTVEGTSYLGLTIIFLFLLFTTQTIFGKNISREKKEPLRWILITVSVLIFALGPTLHLFGQSRFSFLGWNNLFLPLPWILIHKIPLIGEVQETSRLNPFLCVGIAVVSSFSLALLLENYRRKVIRILLSLLLLATVFIEYYPTQFPTTDLRAPEIYKEIAKDTSFFSVMVLPLGFNSGQIALGQSPIGSLQFYQTIHQKPSFRGTVARLPSWAFDYYRKLPVVKYFISPSGKPDEADFNSEEARRTFIDNLHVKYIVIHKKKYGKNIILGETENLIINVLKGYKIYEKEEIVAYKIK